MKLGVAQERKRCVEERCGSGEVSCWACLLSLRRLVLGKSKDGKCWAHNGVCWAHNGVCWCSSARSHDAVCWSESARSHHAVCWSLGLGFAGQSSQSARLKSAWC